MPSAQQQQRYLHPKHLYSAVPERLWQQVPRWCAAPGSNGGPGRWWARGAPWQQRTLTPTHGQRRGSCRRLGRGSCPHLHHPLTPAHGQAEQGQRHGRCRRFCRDSCPQLRHRLGQRQRCCRTAAASLRSGRLAAGWARPPASLNGRCCGRPRARQCSTPCRRRRRQRWRQSQPPMQPRSSDGGRRGGSGCQRKCTGRAMWIGWVWRRL